MQHVTDLELPYLPLEERAFQQDPFSHLDAARGVHPWLARTSFGYILTEYRAIRDMIRYEPHLRMGSADIADFMGAKGSVWGKFIAENIQAQTGATHKRLRDAVNPAFAPARIKAHRPLIRETITELLDEWVSKGRFDFEEFVSQYPISVMCKLLGAPTDVIPRLKQSLEALGLAFSMDPSLLGVLNESVKLLDDFVRDLVAERRTNPREVGEDMLDSLLLVTEQGKMSDEELYSLLIFLFGAGYDTSKNVLTLIMYNLLDRPDVYRRCAEDVGYCRKVMNECLRFMSPASSTRYVTHGFDFRDVHFPQGTVFMMPWSVSGRDETAVSDPHLFDPDRKGSSGHIAFGAGPHICLGQFVAKIQIEEGLNQIAQRIRNPRLAGPFDWRPFPGVWGLRGLPIAFDRDDGEAA